MKKVLAAVIVSFLVLSGLVGCTTKDDTKIKIGVNLELSGDYLIYGTPIKWGVQLAADEINKAGGIDGKEIELVVYDSKSDPTEAYNNALKLATEDEVAVIIGGATSGLTIAQQPVASQYSIPIVTPSGSNAGVTVAEDGKVFDWMFRTCFIDPFQGVVLANFASDDLGLTKAAVLGATGSDYAVALNEIFTNQFKANGGTVVAAESYSDDQTDFSAVLTTLMATDAEILYVPAYADTAGLIIKQARELGWDVPIIGPDGFDSASLLTTAGASNLNKVFFSTHYTALDENPKVAEFITNYKALSGEEPMALSALGYDAMYLIAQSMEEAGSTDRTEIRDAILATSAFTGITGSITFDAKHNPVKSAVVIELVNGVYAKATRVNP